MILPIKDAAPRRFGPATLLLIVANVAAFVASLSVARYGAVPAAIVHGHALETVLTSMFLHAGILHLVGNMWFLMVFGHAVEESMGTVRFVVFYGLSGIVGALAQCYGMPASTVPMIGASGAIAGVMGAYLFLFPRAKIIALVLVFRTKIPAVLFLGLWFAAQFTLLGGDVAWVAHVGGFLGGFALAAIGTTRASSSVATA